MPHSATALVWDLAEHTNELDTYRSGANLKIVLNRPQNGNALTTDMVTQIIQCFRCSAEDPTISRIILTAKGKFFCTGMDLGRSSTGVGKGGDVASNEFKKFTELFDTIDKSPKVTIACVNGPCYAGGVGLAFACDIRLAVSHAKLTLSEVRLGLCPAIISKYVAREWGLAFMREAMLSGRSIAMSELKAIGAIHGLAQDISGLQMLLDSYLADLRSCAPGASTMCKRTVQAAWSYAGTDEQNNVIQHIFEDMMRPDAESSIGLRNFRSKKRSTDWDSLQLSRPKL